ncbi:MULTISPECIES: sulfurtransferase TusA family protein [unclassified Methanoculleus]|jgi:TusA-related sulfurtransferase|uniref:Sulfurtransferase TusA family protein n=1 Tax=Methanoculleus palmolei TaxID=72612 RepID=A0ABD8AAK6_9EURY|nr:sulfurtransferase TusA family protein [Methanoculleus sp. UBA377]MDD2473603.1 sulfurtransferase TusA family protein [Methanoculleus sp.]WOX56057.1 sulfurtransferase TusA family protein [Methanoculleus palmolei]
MGPENKPTAVVDAIGLYCPMPIMMTREAIENLDVGETLQVEADDPAAEEDIRRWAGRVGHKIVKFEKNDRVMRFCIRKMK